MWIVWWRSNSWCQSIKGRQEDNCWSWELRSFTWRFPSASAIFDGTIWLETTARWIYGTLPSLLSFPKEDMYEEVISANDNLRSNCSPDAQSFKKLLEQIFNYHVFESWQYRYFFSCLFTGACGEHVRGSFLYDHCIQVVIKPNNRIRVVVKNW